METVEVTYMDVAYYLSLTGKCLKLRRIPLDEPTGIAPSRGNVIGFSHASRRRLLCYLNSVNWTLSNTTSFVTLTYPDCIPIRKMSYRRNHRNAFVKSLERKLGYKLGIVWRQEWIRRKSGKFKGKFRPHYHLLMFGVHTLDFETVRHCWQRAINYDEPDLQVDVKQVIGHDGAIRYVAKYVAKNPSLDIGLYLDKGFELGRFWGVINPSAIPMCEQVDQEIKSWESLVETVTEAARITDTEGWKLLGGFTLFGDDAIRIFREVQNRG